MENSTGTADNAGVCYNRRCFICRQVTLENSPTNSENLASLLRDFLNCFHINTLDSEADELTSSYQFCPTCEQFIAEWSRIQTYITQLTRRAAQLKATISALLLSAPEIQKQNHDDVTQINNNKIQNSQEVGLPLLLQQTVDDIRNELQKKYSVRVMLDKITIPSVLKLEPSPADSDNIDESWNLWECAPNVQVPYVSKIEPLLECNETEDEPWDNWDFEAHESDEEYLPNEDEINEEETYEEILGLSMETEEKSNFFDSNPQNSLDSKEIEIKDGNTKANRCLNRNKRRYTNKAIIIPDGPNRFQYKGMSFHRNEEDQTYTCATCGFKSGLTIRSIRSHIINHSMGTRKREKLAVPNGPNGLKYNGYDIRLNDEDQLYYCGACNYRGQTTVQSVLAHIRRLHYTAQDKIKFTAVRTSDTEWLYGGKYKIIKVDEKFRCESCGSAKSILHELVSHIRAQHVDLEGPDEAVPLPELDIKPFIDSTQTHGECMSVPYSFNPASKIYTCGLCQSQVSTRNNLRSHMRRNHPDVSKKFACKICGATQASQEGHRMHMKRHQTGTMDCLSCNKQFKYERCFKVHMKIHESGEPAMKSVS